MLQDHVPAIPVRQHRSNITTKHAEMTAGEYTRLKRYGRLNDIRSFICVMIATVFLFSVGLFKPTSLHSLALSCAVVGFLAAASVAGTMVTWSYRSRGRNIMKFTSGSNGLLENKRCQRIHPSQASTQDERTDMDMDALLGAIDMFGYHIQGEGDTNDVFNEDGATVADMEDDVDDYEVKSEDRSVWDDLNIRKISVEYSDDDYDDSGDEDETAVMSDAWLYDDDLSDTRNPNTNPSIIPTPRSPKSTFSRPHNAYLYESEWRETVTALSLYHRMHGDLCMEWTWIVPDHSPWPASLRGTNLSQRIYSMDFWKRHVAASPSRRELLDSMGFLWGRLQPEYNLVMDALLVFKDMYGHLNVPSSFVVPCEVARKDDGDEALTTRQTEEEKVSVEEKNNSESDTENTNEEVTHNNSTTYPTYNVKWPKHLWKMKLGSRVAMMRYRLDHMTSNPKRWYQLQDMGFEWDPKEAGWRRFLTALLGYQSKYGHTRVPRNFVVPSNDAVWPSDLQGYKLGTTVNNVRNLHTYVAGRKDRVETLNQIGFEWNTMQGRFDRLVEALKAYKNVHGTTEGIPSSFVVPHNKDWPRDLRGYELGRALGRVKRRGDFVKKSPERLQLLVSVGLDVGNIKFDQRARANSG